MKQYYNWSLLQGFHPGHMVRIRGVIPTTGLRFHVNFQTHSDESKSDIIFHISVRYGSNQIVLNSREPSGWQHELYSQTLAIVPGQQVELLVACEENQFRLAVNGLHFANFPMRRSYKDIKYLYVEGDITLTGISFKPSSCVLNVQGDITLAGISFKPSSYSIEKFGRSYPFPI